MRYDIEYAEDVVSILGSDTALWNRGTDLGSGLTLGMCDMLTDRMLRCGVNRLTRESASIDKVFRESNCNPMMLPSRWFETNTTGEMSFKIEDKSTGHSR